MAKNPSTRWYFNDWENEDGLMLCSMPAQGLWMRMLCLMARATRPGYLEVDGKAVSASELARRTKAPKTGVSRWLRELEQYGVFSRDQDGAIFNRRMVRENGNGATHKTKGAPPKKTDRERDPNQPELFDNPEKTRTRARPPSSQDSPSISSDPSSPGTAREPEGEKHEKGNPDAGIEIERIPKHPFRPIGRPARAPPFCRKSPAERARIKYELMPFRHWRFLRERYPQLKQGYVQATAVDGNCRPRDPVAWQTAVDGVTRLIEIEGWDDMRQWKHQHGIAA
jgi:hypothetical protein